MRQETNINNLHHTHKKLNFNLLTNKTNIVFTKKQIAKSKCVASQGKTYTNASPLYRKQETP